MDTLSLQLQAATIRRVPHLDQYVGAWCMHAPAFQLLAATVERMDMAAHVSSNLDAVSDHVEGDIRTLRTADGLAVIPLIGMMTKYGSSLGDGFSTVAARRAIRNAAQDATVRGLVLLIDSPGGTSRGVGDLAGEVRSAAAVKPVTAFIEDMGASGAYYVASQATRVAAPKTAMIGSIGTYMVVADYTQAYAKSGVTVHVVRAGEFKGAGYPGDAVTPGQLAEFQREVEMVNAQFLAAVSSGRRMSAAQMQAVATGQVWDAPQAMALGLVDAVETFEDTLAATLAASPSGTVRAAVRGKEAKMAQATENAGAPLAAPEQSTPTPATYAELKAACPDASPAFLCACQEQGLTSDGARSAYLAHLQTELKTLREQQLSPQPSGGPGIKNAAAAHEGSGASTAGKAWYDKFVAMRDEFVRGGRSQTKAHHDALVRCAREDEEGYQAYVAEFNAARPRPRRTA